MAIREEAVRLRLIDDYSGKMSRPIASTALLKSALDDLDGTSVRTTRSLDSIGDTSAKVDRELRRQSASIDQFSGRLRLLAQSAIAVGPALAPLGGVAAAGVAGLASQLGFAALGAGSLIVAAQGAGEALEAVEKASLEPTADNIRAAQVAMENLAPAAQEFVREFEAFRPTLRDIQQSAAQGWFPGLTASLDDLATVGPRVADIFEAIGEAGGRLLSEGAEALTGNQWQEFFDFVQTEAPRSLETLGRAVGNVGTAFAELWMAFQPLGDDFNSVLLDSTRAFADWSAGLSDTQGFQSFVEFIRASGPQVSSALGAIGDAVVQLTQAAAPLGGPVLAGIEALADAIAAIADSPLGTPLLGLATGLSAVNLAAAGIGKGLSSAQTGLSRIDMGSSRAATSLGKMEAAVGRAGVAFAALYAAGTAMELLEDAAAGAAPNVERLTQALVEQDAAQFAEEFGGSLSEAMEALELLDSNAYGLGGTLNDLGEKGGAAGKALATGLGVLTGSGSAMATAGQQAQALEEAFGSLDATLVGIASTQGAGVAEQYFVSLAEAEGLTASQTETLRAQLPGFSDAMAQAGNEALLATDGIAAAGVAAAEAGGGFEQAATGAKELATALAELSGWLDRREALRGYDDAIRELSKSMRNGFTRADIENLDGVGRSIVQVAENMTRGKARNNFIRDAIADLTELADGASPRARAQIDQLIAQLRKVNGTTAMPTVGVETGAAMRGLRSVGAAVGDLDRQSASPNVTAAGVGGAISGIQSVGAALGALDGDSATVTIFRQVVGPTVGGAFGTQLADGGQVRGPGGPRDDVIPALLSNREFVMPVAAVDHYGERFMEQVRTRSLPAFAGGGMVLRDAPREAYALAAGSTATSTAARARSPFEEVPA